MRKSVGNESQHLALRSVHCNSFLSDQSQKVNIGQYLIRRVNTLAKNCFFSHSYTSDSSDGS